MTDTHSTASERLDWLTYPLLLFGVSRALIFAFAKSAPLFGGTMGAPVGLSSAFSNRYPLWSSLGHGDIAGYARVARSGYTALADASFFPLTPLLGKGLGAVVGSVELGLVLLSLAACAAGFVGLYRLFEQLHGREAARWGVGLLAAFPFSYHLSDGSALACVLALSTWGVVLARRGAFAAGGVVLSLAVLAHPAGILSAIAAICLPLAGQPWPRPLRRWAVLVLPGLALLVWALYLRSHLGRGTAALLSELLAKGAPASQAWTAMLVALGCLLAAGCLLLARRPGLRGLALAGGLGLLLTLGTWSPGSAHALVLCWPGLLGLASLLVERQTLRAPLVAMLGAQQGVLLYCFTHFLRLT